MFIQFLFLSVTVTQYGDTLFCFHTQMQVDDFLQALVNFDKEHIPEVTVKCVKEEYLRDPEFNPEFVRQKSSAAAGLCAWVINIIRFQEVRQLSRPAGVGSAPVMFNAAQRWLCSLILDSCLHSFVRLLPSADFCEYTPASLAASSSCVPHVIVMTFIVVRCSRTRLRGILRYSARWR